MSPNKAYPQGLKGRIVRQRGVSQYCLSLMVHTVLTCGGGVESVKGESRKCPTTACCRTYKQGDKGDGKASNLLIECDSSPSEWSQSAVDPEALVDILIDGPIWLIHLSCKTGLTVLMIKSFSKRQNV